MSDELDKIEDALNRYVDDIMDADQRRNFESLIENAPDLLSKVEDYERQRAGLAILFASLPQEAAAPSRRRSEGFRFSFDWLHVPRSAFAALMLGLGATAGWSGAVLSADAGNGVLYADISEDVAQEGFRAHRVFVVDRRHPVEVGGEEQAHLIAWLSNRMEREITAPDFSSAGLQLVGGRLLPSAAGPSAQLMYENENGERVTLYLRSGHTHDGKPNESFIADGDLKAVLWSSKDKDLNFAAIGDVDVQELHMLAKLATPEVEKLDSL